MSTTAIRWRRRQMEREWVRVFRSWSGRPARLKAEQPKAKKSICTGGDVKSFANRERGDVRHLCDRLVSHQGRPRGHMGIGSPRAGTCPRSGKKPFTSTSTCSVEHGSPGVMQKEPRNPKEGSRRTVRDGTRRPYCYVPAKSRFFKLLTKSINDKPGCR